MHRKGVGFGSRLLVAACLAGEAAAADPALLQMLMPDAQTVMWVDVRQAQNSPAGQELKAALDEAIPKWQEQLSGVEGFNWLGQVEELAIARRGGSANDSTPLIAVRGSLTLDQVAALEAFADGKADYLGVPLITSSGKVPVSVAFPDGTHAVIGRTKEVEAAVRRDGSAMHVPAVLNGKLDALEDYDLWVISSRAMPPADKASGEGGAEPLEGAESLRTAAKFHGDFELFAEAAAGEQKDTSKLAIEMRTWFDSFDKRRKKLGLKDVDVKVKGRRVRVTLEAQAADSTQTRPPLTAHAVTSSDRAAPPPGTIRVQSSEQDMGTVLLPAKPGP